MTEIIREWWGVILGFLGGAIWVGKIQQDVAALKENKPVTTQRCDEMRANCLRTSDIQFANGEKQFKEIKELIASNDKASQERHSQVMQILFEMNK